MYRVDRNNFYSEQKDSTVYTPSGVSQFLFDILHDKIDRNGTVMDPCVGAGSLLWPFVDAGFETKGIDVEDQGFPDTIVRDFITVKKGDYEKPSLVIANPPFNIDDKTKEIVSTLFGRRPLLPEVWLNKTVQLWGDVPIVLFAPYGLRLNQTTKSKRWRRFVDGAYPEIVSIVSLPKDVYEGVTFHSEILMFNIYGGGGQFGSQKPLLLRWLDQKISDATSISINRRMLSPRRATRQSTLQCRGV